MTSRFPRQYATQLHVAAESRKDMRAGDSAFAQAARDRWTTCGNLDFNDVPVVQPAQRISQPGPIQALIPYERDVLAGVLQALRLHPRVAWIQRMNSGKFRLPGKDGKLQWVRFGFKGMADITGQLTDGRRLEVECKRPGELPTEDQAAFLTNVRDAGGIAFVAWEVDDVERALRPEVA